LSAVITLAIWHRMSRRQRACLNSAA
jgi:hypothetical protein